MTIVNIGAHMSLGRDPRQTVEAAAKDGFGCMQIFVSSPGAWKPPALEPERAEGFVSARGLFAVDPLFIHAIYLINLASADPTLVERSKASLIATLRAGAQLEAAGVVTHIGSHGGRGYSEVAAQVATALTDVLASTPPQVRLILENSAGAGGLLGAQLEELGDLIERAGRCERLLVALDTAHLCAAGWDFQEPDAPERLVDEVERCIGLERLALLHVNDSKAPCGSRRDRHANIGEGHIGLEGFRHIARVEALRQVPWILETPVDQTEEEHVQDLERLRALLDQSSAPDVLVGT